LPEPVVFIINSLTGGGAERIMMRLLANSSAYAQRWSVHLVLLDKEASAYAPPEWVVVHQLDCRHSLLRSIWGVARVLFRLRPKATLSFLSRSNFANIVAGRLLGARVVISERINSTSHHGNSLSGRISKMLTALLYRHANHVVGVSAGIRDDLSRNYGVSPKRIAVIPNPVDAKLARQEARDAPDQTLAKPVVAAMGRLVPIKNFSLLIEAYAKSGVAGSLLILGDGERRDRLVQLARNLGIADRVVMPGFTANPFAYLARSDCYVLPSNAEGFPNGLVEAMSLGIPVVSTNCPSGPSEILDDAETLEISALHEAKYGILVPTNDAGQMAKAITMALDPTRNSALRKKALAGAERYSIETAVARYWSVIEDGVGKGGWRSTS